MANGTSPAAGILQTIMGLSGAVQQKRQTQASLMESFVNMAAMAPDATALQGLIGTYAQMDAAPESALQEMANQLSRRVESETQRHVGDMIRSTADTPEGRNWARRGASQAISGETPEGAKLGAHLEDALGINLPADLSAKLGISMITRAASGQTPGGMARDFGAASFFNQNPTAAQQAAAIEAGLIMSATQMESTMLGWADLDFRERQAAADSAYRGAMMELQKAQARMEAGQRLTPGEVLVAATLRQRTQEFLTKERPGLSDEQVRQFHEIIQVTTALLQRHSETVGGADVLTSLPEFNTPAHRSWAPDIYKHPGFLHGAGSWFGNRAKEMIP